MNIIFDSKVAQELKDKHVVLELDTVMQPGMPEPLILHALVEMVNISEIATMDFFRDMHGNMITAYKTGDWPRAAELALGLKGQFNKELDEFYQRVIDFSTESATINRTWDGVLHTVPTEDITE
jgi:hypothetical protein